MKFIAELEEYFSGQLNSFKMLFTLIKLEAKLAGMTVIPLIITLFMLFVILITFWASLTVLVGYFIFIQFHSFWLAIGSTLLLNLVILCILLKYFIQNLKAASFEKTRNYLNSQESTEYERIEKTTDYSNK